ncbi:tRNA synthetases class I family protein, partial [Vibrio harveyi]
KV